MARMYSTETTFPDVFKVNLYQQCILKGTNIEKNPLGRGKNLLKNF